MADVVNATDTHKNIKALVEFRLNGKAVKKGQVVAKSDFANKGDWLNLCNMSPKRAEQTSDAVGKPKADALPGAK